MSGRLLACWEGNFSGAMLNFGRVPVMLTAKTLDLFLFQVDSKSTSAKKFQVLRIKLLSTHKMNLCESDILHEGSDVQVFLCSSTPLRRVVGEYWRSCSLELSDSNYISPSPAVSGRPSDYLLDHPDQSGVSGSIHSPTAIHRNGTLSWWICQYLQWHQHPIKKYNNK